MVVPWRCFIFLTAALCAQVSAQSSAFSSASSSAGGLGALSGLGGDGLTSLGDLGGSSLSGLGGLGGSSLPGLGGSIGGLPNIPTPISTSLSLPSSSKILKGFGSSLSGIDILRPLLLSLAPFLFPLTSSFGSYSPYLFLGAYPFIVRYLPDILKGSSGKKNWGNAVFDAVGKVLSNPFNLLPFLIPFLLGGNPFPPPPKPKNGNAIKRILWRLLRLGANPPSPQNPPPRNFGLLSLPPPGAILLYYFWPALIQTWNTTIYQLLNLVWTYIKSVQFNPLPYLANGLFGKKRTGPPKLPNIPQAPNWLFKG